VADDARATGDAFFADIGEAKFLEDALGGGVTFFNVGHDAV